MRIIDSFHPLIGQRRPERTYSPNTDNSISDSSPEDFLPLPQSDEMLLPIDESNPRLLLADSLDKMTHGAVTELQREAIEEIIVHDAEALAAHMIPKHIADAFRLQLDNESATIPRAESNMEAVPATLPEVILLARAYDVTRDEKIAAALNYVLEQAPPVFSDELARAYSDARRAETPIMDVYQEYVATKDTEIDKPKDKAAALIPRLMRRASERHKNQTNDESDTERTGIR